MAKMLAAFVKSLEANCRGKGIGFGYAVFDRDRLYKADGGGRAVRAVNKKGKKPVPAVNFTGNTRLNVHSISKTICAAIIIRALHLNRDVGLDSPIGPFLRPDWEPSDAVKAITFAQLLVHDSGLINYEGAVDNRSYAGMKIAVQRGVVQPPGMRDYQNVNFALGRVLLPYIDGSRDPRELNMLPEPEFNTSTTTHFIDEVRRHLFRFKGGDKIAPKPNGPRPFTRYYDADKGSVCDIEPLPQTNPEHVGASSWWISALEYGQFLSRLQFATDYGRDGESFTPWTFMTDPDRSTTPSLVSGKTFRLGMSEEGVGDKVPALAKSGGGGGGRPTTGWIVIDDLTAVLCINFSNGDLSSGDPDDLKAMKVLKLAGKAAVRAR